MIILSMMMAPAAVAPMQLQTLAWTGTARIHAGEQVIEIGVSTRVVPFQRSRSDTWLLRDGPGKARSMEISGNEGWVIRDSRRDRMPAAMLAHERQQYAIYGLMQQAMNQARPNGSVTLAGPPATQFRFDAAGRLSEARNQVPDPETGEGMVDQVFRFSGEIASNGLRWPRRIDIEQGGKPYFTLELATFEASAP